jgi:hypothetical protein
MLLKHEKKLVILEKEVAVSKKEKEIFEKAKLNEKEKEFVPKKDYEILQKETLLKQQNNEILELKYNFSIQELLEANGLFNSRGLMQWRIETAFYEFNTYNTKKIFDATDTLAYIMGEKSPTTKYALQLRNIFNSCGIFTFEDAVLFWKELHVHNIHGTPNFRYFIRIYVNKLKDKHVKVLEMVAESVSFSSKLII